MGADAGAALPRAEFGIFGGSGFYDFLDDMDEVSVQTPYGETSAPIRIGEVEGHRIAFLPRHGEHHEFPPHRVPYRANVWAMHELGVTRIFGPCAAGSLNPAVEPGHFVACDQLVDRTIGRADTFYEGPETVHISFADPYCDTMRELIVAKGREHGITMHDRGTVVVTQGPRFSTRSESRWFQAAGWEVINMTQYPEAALSREMQMCYANISLITDFDAGLQGHVEPVTTDEVVRVFTENLDKLRELLFAVIPALPAERACVCASALDGARLSH